MNRTMTTCGICWKTSTLTTTLPSGLRDRDLDEIKAQYAALLPEVETTQEFYELIIAPCLSDIGYVGHLGVLYYDEYQLRLYNAENYPQPYDTFTYDTLTAPAVREFYEQMKVTAGTGAVSGAETDTSNLEFDYYPEQKAAYVKVRMMLNDVDPDGELLRAFFMDIEEQGYEHCIIDIRENPGGTDWYWKKNLVMPNITEDTYSTFMRFSAGNTAANMSTCCLTHIRSRNCPSRPCRSSARTI